MFKISMEKEPALTLLYTVCALASVLLCLTHYYFGHYSSLLISLVSIAIYALSAVFSVLNRKQNYGKYFNACTLIIIALLMLFQLALNTPLSLQWIYVYPIICFFALPFIWATVLTGLVFIFTFWQLSIVFELQVALHAMLVYLLIYVSCASYAHLNSNKQKQLLNLAVTDYQSNAYNARFLLHMLKKEISRSNVTHRTLSMLALSIDDHQQIQDIHGNDASIKLLKEFRLKLLTLLRAGDEIFYDGQGTFYILLPNCSIEGVVLLKERLQRHLVEIHWDNVGELQLNAGLATLQENENAEQFLKRASEQVQRQQQTALRLLAFNEG